MATIDASIPLGIRPYQVENPLNSLAKVMQVKGLQQEQQLGQMKMDDYQRGVQEQNRLSGLFRGGADANALRAAGFHKQALEWEEKNAKIGQDTAQTGKYRADTEKTELETKFKKIDLTAQLLSTVRDQGSYDQARATAQANGLDVSRMPPQFDPAFIQSRIQESQSIKEQLEQVWKQKGYDLDVRRVNETGRHNKASEGIQQGQLTETKRHHGVTETNQVNATTATLTKPFEITGEDGKPVLVQQDKQGNIRPVQGYTPKQGASKPLTDTQAKALQFGSRMQAAEDIFSTLADKGVTTSVPGARSGYGVGATISALQPAERQQLDQAKRDFINAVLRRESGAAIAQSEFENAEKQYFPQPGEDSTVRAQKKAARQLSARGILAEVPDADNRVAKVRGGPAADPSNDPLGLRNGR